MDGTILVADDDRTIRTVLTQALTRAGCKVRATSNTSTLWRWVEEGEGDAVITDVMMPDGNGLDLLPAIGRKRPDLPVIVISAQNTVVTAIRASEAGAFDYIPKPFDLRDLLTKVNRALHQNHRPVQADQTAPPAASREIPLVGGSPAMQEVYRIVARVVNTNLNVMITGASGTGKDLLATTLHKMSQRQDAPFVRVHCATADVDSLIETLSDPTRDGASIYLENVGDLSPDSQRQILGVMQNADQTGRNLRFLSANPQPVADLVNQGTFREDLFYRLNVMPIAMPALRDRIDDIPDLTQHFLRQAEAKGLPLKTISKQAVELLRNATWPGNVRDLENTVHRLIVLCAEDEINSAMVADALKSTDQRAGGVNPAVHDKLSTSVEAHIKRYFDLHGDALPPPGLYTRILREVELPLIALSLSATRGNQIKTAELLGINRNTLRKKIRELDIQVTRTKKMM